MTRLRHAHNLAWKLAAACRGEATDALLDTYHAERAPLDRLTVAQALLRAGKTPGQPDPPDQIDTATLTLGFRYPTGGCGDRALVENPATPSGRPGTRAAHVALRDGRSVLDLLDPSGFTLVCHAADPAASLPPIGGVRLRAIPDDGVDSAHRRRFATAYGNGLLIRPDGVVAWRGEESPTPDAVRTEVRRSLMPTGDRPQPDPATVSRSPGAGLSPGTRRGPATARRC